MNKRRGECRWERQTCRQTRKETEKDNETERQTETDNDRQAGRQTNRQTDRQKTNSTSMRVTKYLMFDYDQTCGQIVACIQSDSRTVYYFTAHTLVRDKT